RPERGRRRCGTEVACECIAHPERPREARAGTTGAENPDRRERHVRGHRADAMERMVRGRVAAREHEQLLQLCGELLCIERSPCRHCGAIGAGCPPDAEVDAVGMEGFEGVECGGEPEGCMVGEHDAA